MAEGRGSLDKVHRKVNKSRQEEDESRDNGERDKNRHEIREIAGH